MKKDIDSIIRQYLTAIARKGGQARAKKYGKTTLSKWAKKGGRPRKRKDGEK
jgi:hypothetical protein